MPVIFAFVKSWQNAFKLGGRYHELHSTSQPRLDVARFYLNKETNEQNQVKMSQILWLSLYQAWVCWNTSQSAMGRNHGGYDNLHIKGLFRR